MGQIENINEMEAIDLSISVSTLTVERVKINTYYKGKKIDIYYKICPNKYENLKYYKYIL